MSRTTHLTQRKGVYYARITVPKVLRKLREARGLPNPREIQKSFATRDPKVAEIRIAMFKAQTLQAFANEEEALRQAGIRPLHEPDEHDLERALWDFKRDELQLEEQERVHRPSASEVEALLAKLQASLACDRPSDGLALLAHPAAMEYLRARDAAVDARERREILAAELQSHMAAANYVLVDFAIEALRQRHGWRIERDTVAYKKLARELMKAWIQVLKTADRREQGDYEADTGLFNNPVTSLPTSQVLTQPSRDAEPTRPRKGESFLDYFDAYLKERKQHVGASGRIDLRATARQFVDCNGSRAVSAYGKADMAKYKKGLRAYPKNAGKLYPGLKFSQVIERNRKDGHPLLASRSIRNKLSALSAFGQWLEDNVDGVDANNFKTSLPAIEDAERMEPFSGEEVRAILNSYAFTGSRSARTYKEPGEHRLRDWHFWLPLISAFTGARLNEVVQLEVADLRQQQGIWVFHITDGGNAQSLKNDHSRRVIPVHPQLIDLGLLDRRAAAVAAGETALFHDVPLGRDGRRSGPAGKWFRKFLGLIGVKGKDNLGGSHRWRHTLTDSLRRGGVDDYQIASILGHQIDVAKMTGHYGREVAMSLQMKLELLSKAAYPTVDFDLLR